MPNNLGLQKVSIIDRNELLNADTIKMIYKSNGCFHNYIEKTNLIKDKKKDVYSLNTIIVGIGNEPLYLNEKVSLEIVNDLFIIQQSSTKLKADTNKKGLLFFSTTRRYLYILVNNKLFRFDDSGLKYWDLYDEFKSKYLIQTK